MIPSSGIADAYAASKNPEQEGAAIAIYLSSWMVVTFLFLFVPHYSSLSGRRTHSLLFLRSIGSLRKSIGLTVLFFLLTLTFMLLAVGQCCLLVSRWAELIASMCDSRLPEERIDWQGWWRCWHCNRSCRLLLRSRRPADRGRYFHHPSRQIPTQDGLKKVHASCLVIPVGLWILYASPIIPCFSYILHCLSTLSCPVLLIVLWREQSECQYNIPPHGAYRFQIITFILVSVLSCARLSADNPVTEAVR